MIELPLLQEAFQQHLLDPQKLQIKNSIISTKNVSAEKRLAIYAHAYKSRLVETLTITYPALLIYMGEERFNTLGNEYADVYPSTFRSIRWFGDHLSDFLQQHAVYQNYPYLAELAQIEWLMALVFDSENAQSISIETLSHISPNDWINMKLQPHPSLHRVNLSWNVVALWQALNNEEDPPAPEINETPIPWIFWRKDLMNHFCSIAEDEAWAIDAMQAGASFGEICEGLANYSQEDEHIALRAASLLKAWTLAALITHAHIP